MEQLRIADRRWRISRSQPHRRFRTLSLGRQMFDVQRGPSRGESATGESATGDSRPAIPPRSAMPYA
jgi:hypothetical protein